MTDVIAGQTVNLTAQFYDYQSGPLTDLDAAPSIGITNAATGAAALAPTTTGVTHPGTGTYAYAWTTASALTSGLYLALWSGTKSGTPVSATENIAVTEYTVGRVYATVAEYEAVPGQNPAPPNTAYRLVQASRMLERLVLRYCVYDVDSATGMPTHPAVIAALRDAVIAQVAWWGEVGDPSGSDAVGWGSVGIGSVQLSRSVTAVSGEDSPARQLAPAVWDALYALDLTNAVFLMGVVSSC